MFSAKILKPENVGRWDFHESLEIILPILSLSGYMGMAWCHENQGGWAFLGGQLAALSAPFPEHEICIGSEEDLLFLKEASSSGLGRAGHGLRHIT